MRYLFLFLFAQLSIFASPYPANPNSLISCQEPFHIVKTVSNVWDFADYSGEPAPRDLGCRGSEVSVVCNWVTPREGASYNDGWKDEYQCQTCEEGTEYVPQSYSCEIPCQEGYERDETGECQEPICPPDQHNEGTDAQPLCVCDNGLPKVLENDVPVCQASECPLDYDDPELGRLTIAQQNQSYEDCIRQYPLTLYNVKYIADDYLSCCFYGDKSVSPECPIDYHKNNNGICVENSDDDAPEDCPTEYYYSYETGKCEPFFPDDNGSSAGDGLPPGSSGGANGGSGSVGDANNTSPYYGGANGSQNDDTSLVTLEYNSEEVSEVSSDYVQSMNDKSNDFIDEYLNVVTSLYKIQIPVSPSCGCQNVNANLAILGHSYHIESDICTPLETILNTTRPLLWFLFLIGLLYRYFRN